MRAIVLHEYGGPDKLKLEDVADPSPGGGEVLVRTAATSVNPIDYKIRSGEAKARYPIQFPFILGRDLAGTVLALGSGVENFAVGDRVMAMTQKTYAEQVVVPAAELCRVPDELDIVDAAAIPLVALTGHQLVTLGVKPEKGSTVLVTGAVGSVGRFAVYAAKQLGATVFAGVREEQRKEAEALGADQVIALDSRGDLAKLSGLDSIADTVGGETADQLLSHLKPNGVFASVLGPPSKAKDFPGLRIAPIQAKPDAGALAELAEAVAAHRLVLPIDRMLPLAQAAEAQRVAEKGGVGKILLMA